ncbi:hypothetical protein PLICRDRAFT_46434 [Plicaturopsis crispa FD-325 SS-3]|uniref:RlpA-like protein double-psi beta-barrel domain-containing protein n=1 Tax=Plicaturopsis crispa FD-325 SS-3 TaxID=944288 RepID=A0A0C9T7D8_PLICR|nr:hypothetical protein PLICRDRAFT_46434 [Plicaturopsis crispa FD-325 SS-3]
MFSRINLLAVALSFMSLASAQNIGEGTYFAPGLGACGVFNTDADSIVAVSATFFDTFPGATANPNLNPVCNRQISITYAGITVPAIITDKCPGCAGLYDLDMSPAVFNLLADPAVGRLTGVAWEFV